jgi:hypothetical protein
VTVPHHSSSLIVPDGKGQGQPACQKEWKKCEEEEEEEEEMNSNADVM